MKYSASVTLLANIDVEAETLKEARSKIRQLMSDCEANLGMLDNEPVVVNLELEGEIDVELA